MADNPNDFQVWKTVTIADSAALSGALNVQGWDVMAIEQPANCEGTAFTFQASQDGSTFADVYDNTGTELSVTKSATAAQLLTLGTKQIQGVAQIKVRSGTTGAPTNQTGAATIKVGLRKVA